MAMAVFIPPTLCERLTDPARLADRPLWSAPRSSDRLKPDFRGGPQIAATWRSPRAHDALLVVSLVGVVRAEFLRARNFDYVRAARALGVRHALIMVRHVLPNAMVATLTFLPFILNGSITTLTSLDFLGFGLPPGSASLGEILAQGKANLQAPWLGLTSFMVLAVMLSLLIFIGEAVRDAFDPRRTL